jgi:hypothetical protein
VVVVRGLVSGGGRAGVVVEEAVWVQAVGEGGGMAGAVEEEEVVVE